MATQRLSEKKIKKVQELLAKGATQKVIAEKVGVSTGTVANIKRGGIVAKSGAKAVKVLTPPLPKPFRTDTPMVREDAIAWIHRRKKGFKVQSLADKLECTQAQAKEVIEYLTHHDGYNIIPAGLGTYSLLNNLPPMDKLSLPKVMGEDFTFGVVSDTHMCNENFRPDVLEAAYDYFAQQGITTVFHAGNLIDGEFHGNMYEITAHGMHDQACVVAGSYPQRKGITTYFITGDCHEGWYQKREGVHIGFYIQKVCEEHGRTDMVHIGHIEQDVILEMPYGKMNIRIMHPGGGSAYATSYSAQKLVESFQGGDKPNLLLMGHYHKFCFNMPREVPTIQCGCMCDQTTFMRKLKLIAEVGFMTVTIGKRLDGTIGHVTPNWVPFYDAKYHRRLEGYVLPQQG
jgi:predicted phosphodiesterase/transcriptional regulator